MAPTSLRWKTSRTIGRIDCPRPSPRPFPPRRQEVDRGRTSPDTLGTRSWHVPAAAPVPACSAGIFDSEIALCQTENGPSPEKPAPRIREANKLHKPELPGDQGTGSLHRSPLTIESRSRRIDAKCTATHTETAAQARRACQQMTTAKTVMTGVMREQIEPMQPGKTTDLGVTAADDQQFLEAVRSPRIQRCPRIHRKCRSGHARNGISKACRTDNNPRHRQAGFQRCSAAPAIAVDRVAETGRASYASPKPPPCGGLTKTDTLGWTCRTLTVSCPAPSSGSKRWRRT